MILYKFPWFNSICKRMSFSREEVSKLASLACLAQSADELDTTRDKLTSIFGLIEQLQAVDTTGIEPMSHPQDATQRLRADHVTESDRRDEFQQLAPQTADGLYLVPRVIE